MGSQRDGHIWVTNACTHIYVYMYTEEKLEALPTDELCILLMAMTSTPDNLVLSSVNTGVTPGEKFL